MLCKLGMVDKGVAVALHFIYCVVALDFLVADRVLTVPFQQQVHRPCSEKRIAVAGEHVALPARVDVVVARCHIEICACEVALVFIIRLENRAAVPRERARTAAAERFHRSARRHVRTVGTLAERQVAALIVHIAVGRIEVIEVGIHRISVVKPALGERVLAVVAIAD